MKLLAHLLGALWCLPATILVWLFYILPSWIFKDIEFKQWDGPFIARFKIDRDNPNLNKLHSKWWSNWGGLGLPCAYIYRDDSLHSWDRRFIEKTCRHERRHCIQWFILGPLFPFVYCFGLLIGAIRGDPYKMNPLEIDARKAERKE